MLSEKQIERMLDLWGAPWGTLIDMDYDLYDMGLVYILGSESMWSPRAEYILSKDNESETRKRLREFTSFDDISLFINVYKVTREYGGPEEGGWYFDYFKFIEGYPVVGYNRADEIRDLKQAEFDKIASGDVSSVNGGFYYAVHVELNEADSETKEWPIYE